ncbi:hypothetical protein J1605_001992 [Eschrichtius robustus]|uniref:Uncharacterized protein n=1 Tax=Eschrichtius robustus TaxID=9764 RepID=A0AB34GRK5_ESCRO|nr:hypothetical protein J1605_010459 [Eschrichtius robustus]KAJ8796921.1 hypothetical protein J1605_001992 [Eschrichtius robustus]
MGPEVSAGNSRAIGPCGSGGPLSTPGPLLGSSSSSPPPQIVINPARQKMVQKLALYEDGVLDSLQLLSSSSLPGTPRTVLCSRAAGLWATRSLRSDGAQVGPPLPEPVTPSNGSREPGRPPRLLWEVVYPGYSPVPAPSPPPDDTHLPLAWGYQQPPQPRSIPGAVRRSAA